MGIFTRFTLRSLARNRVRTAVTVAGIALSTALMTAVLTSVGSMQAALLERTVADEGSWHIFTTDVSDEALNALEADGRTSDIATFEELGSAADCRRWTSYSLTASSWPVQHACPTVAKGSVEPDGRSRYARHGPSSWKGGMPADGRTRSILPDYAQAAQTLGRRRRAAARAPSGPLAGVEHASRSIWEHACTLTEACEPVVLSSVDEWRHSVEQGTGTVNVDPGDVSARTLPWWRGFYERQPPFTGEQSHAVASVLLGRGQRSPAPLTGIGEGEVRRDDGRVRARRGASAAWRRCRRSWSRPRRAWPTMRTRRLYHGNICSRTSASPTDRPIWGTLWMRRGRARAW